MISTDPKGQGGIATVVSSYNKDGLFNTSHFTLIKTHSSDSKNKLSAAILFFSSLLKVIFYGLLFNLGIVHVHMASRGSYLRKSIILRVAKKLGAKTIIHLHGGEFESFYHKECSDKKKTHIKKTFNMADKIIVLSSSALTWVNSIVDDKTKTCIVYNAVPAISLPPKKSVQANILFLGRLSKNKGVDDLIHAFAQLSVTYPHLKLLLAGDGDPTKYKTLAAKLGVINHVNFLGWVSGTQKKQYLADATVYCLPSYYEGFPMGVLEAMSAGIPVVASTAGGIPDAITNKQEGLLVKAGDVGALTEALRSLLSDEKLRAQYSDAAKIKYQENFSPDVIIPQLKNIYKELLDK
ncbi:glycosyltransferase family 4 protein [Colwellia asteriadis]